MSNSAWIAAGRKAKGERAWHTPKASNTNHATATHIRLARATGVMALIASGNLGDRPRRRLAQHFLQDPQIAERMVAAMAPKTGQHVVEIGPGRGALTRPLMKRVSRLDVIEVDCALAARLGSQYSQCDTLRVHCADALSFELSQLGHESTRLRVVGNLPYNISTPLLFRLLEQRTRIQDMHLMLQYEVVRRITASPGHRNYGRLSVMVQFSCDAEQLFTVPPSAFYPRPRVNSAVVRLVVRARAPTQIASHRVFASVVKQAFAQRRKSLRNALRGLVSEAELVQAKINPSARAETLSVGQFATLANIAHAAESGVAE